VAATRRMTCPGGRYRAPMAADTAPQWRGVNHLAMVTNDMDGTVRFYHGVLGMPLVATIAVGPMRHYFFRIGPESTIAFFEWSGSEIGTFEKPAGMPFTFPAQFDHVSFTLPDEAALEALQGRLDEHGTEITRVVDHGFVRSVYFHDNNGIALEASWWVRDPTGTVEYDDTELFGDSDPVPAVRELVEAGDLTWTPATHLAGSTAQDPA
jgi:catechol 2,3-dioxygenase-like lactoylglutathione lyase family enzyme